MEWYALKGDGSALLGHPFFSEPRLNAQLAACSGTLWRMEGGRRFLALPWRVAEEFPLVELFCLASVRVVRGRSYVVYCVDAQGRPETP